MGVLGGVAAVTLVLGSLADGGMASSLGASSNSASNMVFNCSVDFLYSGNNTANTDRLFTMAGTLSSYVWLEGTGAGSLNFTNPGTITLNGTGGLQFLLAGTRDGSFAPMIGNRPGGNSVLSKYGSSTWTVSGQNTYTGMTGIAGGTLAVTFLADGGLPSSIGASTLSESNLLLTNDGTLKYIGAGTSTNRLFHITSSGGAIDASGTGPLNFTNSSAIDTQFASPGAVLTFTGPSTLSNTFAPAIGNGSNAFAVRKTATGTWTLGGANTYTGATTIDAGRLNVNGSLAAGSSVTVNGGTLGGTGSVAGSVLVQSGDTVAPGTSPGILNVNSVTFSTASTLEVEIAGSSPGNGAGYHDQLNVTGNPGQVTLGGANLDLSFASGFTPAVGNTFVVVNNAGTDAVSGTFAGKPDGSVFTAGGTAFAITYKGGSNLNDVVLIAGIGTVPPLDYGDAPDTGLGTGTGNYQTTALDGGPSHVAIGPTLGTNRDIDADGQQSVDAKGDDNSSTPDDEDGIEFRTTLVPGQSAKVRVAASAASELVFWVDFNQNGVFENTGERFTHTFAAGGAQDITFAVPAGAALGTTYARFRLGSTAAADSLGPAADGEVEDYRVELVNTPQNTFCVANTNDSGAGSLRQAILDANATANLSGGRDLICFHIPGAGPHAIRPISALPAITGAVLIDGYSQPGSAQNTNPFGMGLNAVLQIELDGSDSTNTFKTGLVLNSNNAEVRGLVINRFQRGGILITGSDNAITGNYIGTDITGQLDLGNVQDGVEIRSSNNLIGGAIPEARNLIAGNSRYQVFLSGLGACDNVVQGNLIGTTASGNATIPNSGWNINIDGGARNIIGGDVPGAGNVISGSGGGVIAFSGTQNAVQGNFIGLDATGTIKLGNGNFGINMIGGNGNLIGGLTPAARNIVSGNTRGLWLTTNNVQVVGNYIGTDVTGTVKIANTFEGIRLAEGGNTFAIGGVIPAARNVISGNGTYGILVSDHESNVTIQGNYIGIDATGTVAMGNVEPGIRLSGLVNRNILVGGDAVGAGNVISGNPIGIDISGSTQITVQGNLIGTNASGSAPIGNGTGIRISGSNSMIGGTTSTSSNLISGNVDAGIRVDSGIGHSIRNNAVFANGGLGIDLGSTGPTLNDIADADTGANNLQNFPVIASAISGGGTITITGTLNSTANATFGIEFFSSSTADPSGFGEGQNFLGFTSVSTGAGGNGNFSASFAASVPAGHVVTATATDPAGNTSEFSGVTQVTAAAKIEFSAAATSDMEDNNVNLPRLLVNGTVVSGQTIDVTVTGGTASGTDFSNTVTVTIPPGIYDGTSTVPINLTITNDGIVEANEAINLTLANPTSSLIISDANWDGSTQQTHAHTIQNDDSATVSINDVSASETDGVTTLNFTVTLSHAVDTAVSFDYRTQDDTATTVNNDYTAMPLSTRSFASTGAGATETISVTVFGDDTVELSEAFQVLLSSLQASGRAVTLGTHGVGTILNDDSAVLNLDSVSGNEDDGPLTFTAKLTNPVDVTVTAQADSADGSATTADSDHTALVAQGISITAGSLTDTFSVSITADNKVELDELFDVLLSILSAGGRSVTLGTDGIGTILNDDSAVISINASSATEGTALGYSVTMSNPVDVAVTADRQTQDGTATTADADYTALALASVTLFAAGSTTPFAIPVSTTADHKVELEETLQLVLSSLAAGGRNVTFSGAGATLAGQGTITNDDSAAVSINDVSQSETDGATTFSFVVTLSNPVDTTVSATVDTADGSATAAHSGVGSDDYEAIIGGTVSFAPGVTSQTIDVTVNGDDLEEADENVFVVLSNLLTGGRDVTFANNQGAGTMLNDDFAHVAHPGGPYEINEGDSLHLDASASTDTDDGLAGLTFRWDVDGDSDFDENVFTATPILTWAQLNALDIPINDGPDGPRTITVEASDGINIRTASTTLTVHNVAPVITGLVNSSGHCGEAMERQAITLSGTFTDVGMLDTHSAVINWGDGNTSAASIVQGSGGGSFSGSRAYASGGVYTITVTLTDDDTGTHLQTTQAIISGVGVVGNTLYVIGTGARDVITINQQGNGITKVHASFLPNPKPFRDVANSTFERIIVMACDGNDHINIAGNVTKPVLVDGGDGDDHINGGGGRAILMGGAGSDRLVGGKADDLLIASGTTLTRHTLNLAVLDQLFTAWNGMPPYTARAAAVDAILDGLLVEDDAADLLTGGAGRDLFYANLVGGITDKITDLASNEQYEEL